MINENELFISELMEQVHSQTSLQSPKKIIARAGLANLGESIGEVLTYMIEREYGWLEGCRILVVNFALIGVEIDPDDGELMGVFGVSFEDDSLD